MRKFKANFKRAGGLESTRWYESAEAAQDALMKKRNVGSFNHLGRVAGDGFEMPNSLYGYMCISGARNGGVVDIDMKDFPE